jgi:hypothetical protein
LAILCRLPPELDPVDSAAGSFRIVQLAGDDHLDRHAGENRMCNLYSITTNQAAIIALLRVMEPLRRQPAAHASLVSGLSGSRRAQRRCRTRADDDSLGMPPPPKFGGPAVTNIHCKA